MLMLPGVRRSQVGMWGREEGAVLPPSSALHQQVHNLLTDVSEMGKRSFSVISLPSGMAELRSGREAGDHSQSITGQLLAISCFVLASRKRGAGAVEPMDLHIDRSY